MKEYNLIKEATIEDIVGTVSISNELVIDAIERALKNGATIEDVQGHINQQEELIDFFENLDLDRLKEILEIYKQYAV